MIECDSCGGSGADMPDIISGSALLKGQVDSCKVCGGSGWITSSEKEVGSENKMKAKKRRWWGSDPADPATESISGITLPTVGSHATTPFAKPARRLCVSERNRIIQEKSGLNFYVFTERVIHGTQRLVEDPDLATVLADKLEERRELKKLVSDLLPYIYHKANCDAHTPARGPCGCQFHEVLVRIVAAVGVKDEDE